MLNFTLALQSEAPFRLGALGMSSSLQPFIYKHKVVLDYRLGITILTEMKLVMVILGLYVFMKSFLKNF